jgi:phage replication-related protein YjqB (UPF0714/DUF867 family)/RimJ/RimL family protein N-acetyltransferase
MDKYGNFDELNQGEPEGSFAIFSRNGTSGIAVIAPHGGAIEPGTTEIASSIAGNEHAYYTFTGRKRIGNNDLHITSTNFDEPIAMKIVKRSQKVLAIHGCTGQDPIGYIGGRDAILREQVQTALVDAGFQVRQSSTQNLKGDHPRNICNRGERQRGVQLEISEGLRQQMFRRLTSRKGREVTHEVFEQFVAAIRMAILPVELEAAEVETPSDEEPKPLKMSWLRRWGDDEPLETEHLLLRGFRDSDLNDLERILTNRTAARSFPLGLPHTKKKIVLLHGVWKAQVWNYGALVLKEEDQLIGFTGVRKLRGNYETEFFYHIEPRFWSEDLAVEAARGWLTKYFRFSASRLPQLAAVAIPTDLSACRVLGKLGMKYVKTIRSHGSTLLYYEISRQQFQAAR